MRVFFWSMINQKDYLHIGEIYREHGIHGAVKVYVYSKTSENFREGMKVWLQKEAGDLVEAQVMQVSPYNRWFLTQFSVFKTPEEASQWRKASVWILKKDLSNPDTKEHYLSDLIGFIVVTNKDRIVGCLQGMQGEGESALFVVASDSGEEILIPVVKKWILEIDKKNKKIILSLPEGLIE